MPNPVRVMQSPYMNWAKLDADAEFNLASSGILNCVLADLGPPPRDLELHGPNSYGYAPLLERLAARFGTSPDCVVSSQGTSMANHLALAALLEPGDEVVLEDPTYELVTSTLGYLQARIRRFERRAEDGFALDVEAVLAAMTPATRLVVVTNLHNPTSAPTSRETMRALAEAVAERGANLFVDEVYLELTFQPDAWTAFTLAPNVVVTSSLTKAYGVSGLRAGWILAQPELAQRMRRLNDLYGSVPVFMAEPYAVQALDRLERLRARADALLEANRAAWREHLEGHPRLDPSTPFRFGTTIFPRLLDEDAEAFCDRLRHDYRTTVVPGRFFDRPDRFRVGFGGEPQRTREGLLRLRQALDAL